MTTPAPDPMLLPPAMVPSDPIHVSTFARPEYADLTFTYGKVKSGGTWPVHCKWFKVRVPTGRQATALTSEPSLIRSDLTVPANKPRWIVTRDTRDPNEVVFTCEPPPDEPAAFDGTWSIELKLWGIEVNGGIGPVNIVWEESTSTTGADGPFKERAGRGEVSKCDDSFYLHSFRPASVAIARNTKATLHWEGTPQATYTMYYRAQNGTQASSPAKDGEWESPITFLDDTSFTLEARMDNEVRYLTTYIKVNNPSINVTSVAAPTATGSISVTNDLTLHAGRTLKVDKVNATTATGRLTIGSNVLTTGDLSLGENKTLDTDHINARTASAIKVVANLTLEANRTLTAGGPVNIATGQTLSAGGPVSIAAGQTLTTNGPVQANGNVTIKADKTLKVALVNPTNDNGEITVRGNVAMEAGKNITIPRGGGELVVADAFVAKSHRSGWSWPRVDIGATAGVFTDGGINLRGDISASGMKAGGKRVVRNGDRILLRNNVGGNANFLYHASQANQWDNVVARQGNNNENTRWYVVSEAGDIASNDAVDANEPSLPADPEDATAGPGAPSA